jgi:hypothetical protein
MLPRRSSFPFLIPVSFSSHRFSSSGSASSISQQQRRSPLGNSQNSNKQQDQSQENEARHQEEFNIDDGKPKPFFSQLTPQMRAAISGCLMVVISLPLIFQRMQQDERNRQEMLRIEEQAEREIEEEIRRKKAEKKTEKKP